MGIDRYHNCGLLSVASTNTISLTRLESGAPYPQERPYFQLFQMVEMRSIGALQPHQPKPVEVKTVVPNRTRFNCQLLE